MSSDLYFKINRGFEGAVQCGGGVKKPHWPIQRHNGRDSGCSPGDSQLVVHHPNESLFRQRPNVRKMLIDNIEQGMNPGRRDRYGLHYVLAKFHVKYFRDFKKVEVEKKKEEGDSVSEENRG